MSLPGTIFLGSLPNNSAVILSNEGNKSQEVICHSAQKSSCPGRWLDLDKSIHEDCDVMESEVVAFNSVRLDLNSVSDKGVVACVTEDENGEEQRLYLGVYMSGTCKQQHGLKGDVWGRRRITIL